MLRSEWLFKQLVYWARGDGWTDREVDLFAFEWSQLNKSDPLPCPLCFFSGNEGGLTVLPKENESEPVQCEECGEKYLLPVPH